MNGREYGKAGKDCATYKSGNYARTSTAVLAVAAVALAALPADVGATSTYSWALGCSTGNSGAAYFDWLQDGVVVESHSVSCWNGTGSAERPAGADQLSVTVTAYTCYDEVTKTATKSVHDGHSFRVSMSVKATDPRQSDPCGDRMARSVTVGFSIEG